MQLFRLSGPNVSKNPRGSNYSVVTVSLEITHSFFLEKLYIPYNEPEGGHEARITKILVPEYM